MRKQSSKLFGDADVYHCFSIIAAAISSAIIFTLFIDGLASTNSKNRRSIGLGSRSDISVLRCILKMFFKTHNLIIVIIALLLVMTTARFHDPMKRSGRHVDMIKVSSANNMAIQMTPALQSLKIARATSTSKYPSVDSRFIRRLQSETGTWVQMGSDIDGEAAEDYSGWSTSVSSDGMTVVIGAILNDGNGSGSGHVRVYKYDGTDWSQMGSDIDGEAEFDHSGVSTSVSADGMTVAIGANGNGGNGTGSGHVRMYNYTASDWVKMGNDIDGEATGDGSGQSTSLSSDGMTVAIGAGLNDGNGTTSGHVRIYKYDGTDWSQMGSDIDGEAASDESGGSTSISSDGLTVAIGAHTNNGNGSNSGHVRVYNYTASDWLQMGNDIDGEAAENYAGVSTSLSSGGLIVAVGARGNDDNGSLSGHVRIYKYDGTDWLQMGSDIDGEAGGDNSGVSTSLSSDGMTVAIGAMTNDGGGTGSGHVRIYKYDGTDWSQMGSDIDGEAAGDQSGYSTSISSDGLTVAVGARQNDGNGTDSGHVRVFKWVPASWDIEFLDWSADFGMSSTQELNLNYIISNYRRHEAFLYEYDCQTNITGLTFNLAETKTTSNATHNSLILDYDIDTSSIATSSVWNDTFNTIQLCHVLYLVEPAHYSLPMMVVQHDTRTFDIAFDPSAEYEFNNSLKNNGIMSKEAELIDLDGYIEAYKCTGIDFVHDSSPLKKNKKLHICIKALSPGDVELDDIGNMVIDQGATNLSVVDDYSIVTPSITSIEHVPAEDGIHASTQVPLNMFDYKSGQNITVYGDIDVKLTGSRRHLLADLSKNPVVAETEKTTYQLQVSLQDESTLDEEDLISDGSCTCLKNKAAIVMALAVALII